MTLLRRLSLAALCLSPCFMASNGAETRVRSMALCSGVTLSASYLAASAPGQADGFHFILVNRTGRAIHLAAPVPSSSDWYSRVQGRWLWRASSGAGGTLLHAWDEHGKVVVYGNAPTTGDGKVLTVLPHKSLEWSGTEQDNPVLAYKPGCKMCSHPGEHEYRVIFGYAYAADAGAPAGQLACGLRTAPVPMPPKF